MNHDILMSGLMIICEYDEDEEECVEAPVDDVEDDVPMADEWVNFTYEVFW